MLPQAAKGDQAQYRLIERSPHPVMTLGAGLEVEYLNPAALNLLGLQPANVVGKRLDLAIPNVFLPKDVEEIGAKCLVEGAPLKIIGKQVELLKPGGSPIAWLDIDFEPLTNEDQKIAGVVCYLKDVTSNRVDYQGTGERLRLITNAINAGTFDYDIEKEIIHWSPQLRKLVGIDEHTQVTQELSRDIVHPDDRQIVLPKVDSTRQDPDQDYVAVDYRIIRKDTGEVRWIHTRSKTFYRKVNGDLRAVRMLGFSMDITESKATEERLRQFNIELEQQVKVRTEELSLLNRVLAEAQKVSKLGSWEWDVVAGHITWSDEMFDLYGYQEKFAVDFTRATERMTAADSERSRKRTEIFIKEAVDIFSSTGSRTFDIPPIEYKIKIPDGPEKILRNSGKIYLTHEGKLEKIFGTVQDVTEIRSTELQLQAAIEELEEKNKDLQAFSYIASHDLKEPLRKILTFTSRLSYGNVTATDDYISRINSAAERMMDLIESVLTFSQMSNSPVELTNVDLNTILESCKSDLELRIRETEATITSTGLEPIKANAAQMNQLFSNLIGNSLKFCKDKPRVDIHMERVTDAAALSGSFTKPQQCWRITFSDNGIGFDPKYTEQIFEPFKRLHGKDAYRGNGIGLSIVKKIVERHKGNIEVDSTPGKGTRFTIFLPC